MKKVLFKILTICLACLLTFSTIVLVGCGDDKTEDDPLATYPVDKQYIYGMDYIAYEGIGNGIDYVKAFELMHNLGVTSIRNWMHVTWFFNADLTRNEANITTMHKIIEEAYKYDIQLIGMSHKNINNSFNQNAKPFRDMTDGSYYQEWLVTYEESWRLLAEEFPEITYWEIDNECNNTDFMPRIGGGTFSQTQMAAIFTDMLFYASRGIHAGNPNAITVMGGLTEVSGLGSGQTKSFIQKIYNNIASYEYGEGDTNPDHYFECLAWHPYSKTFDADSFVKYNDEIYDVVIKNENKHKKVFLTEVGNWSTMDNQELAASYVTALYQTVRDRMPYVESAHLYRAFDNLADNNCQGGIFYDPNPDRSDMVGGVRMNPGAPKALAYAYQAVAGGTGSLSILETVLN